MHFPTRSFAASTILLGTALLSIFSVERKNANNQRSLRAGDVNITQLLQNFSKEFPEFLNRKPDYFQTTAPASSTGLLGLPSQSVTPTTRIPTTMVPAVVTTSAPSNRKVPLTSFPKTTNPVSSAPFTLAPITSRPITIPPITSRPITIPPVTSRPTTLTPITSAPTTLAPVSSLPTTLNPITLTPTTLYPVNSIPTTSNSTSLAPNMLPLSPPLSTSESSNSLPVFSSQGLPINISLQTPPFTSTIPSNWTGSFDSPPLSEPSAGGIPMNTIGRPPVIPNSSGTFGTLPLSKSEIPSNVVEYGSISSPSSPFIAPNVMLIPNKISMKPPEVNWSEKHRNASNSSAGINHYYDTTSVNNAQSIKHNYLLISLAAVFISFALFVTVVRYSRMHLCSSPHFHSIV